MTGMKSYYLSRAAVSIGFGVLFLLGGSSWWVGLLVAALAFAWFLIAPRIGRYAVRPELGPAALQRDERSQMINDKSARNAFVVTMLALAGVGIYFRANGAASAPTESFTWLLLLGAVVYYVSDIWMRKATS